MNTAFILLAQYDGAAIIPIEAICRDYFAHLTPREFIRKTYARLRQAGDKFAGWKWLPIVTANPSQR